MGLLQDGRDHRGSGAAFWSDDGNARHGSHPLRRRHGGQNLRQDRRASRCTHLTIALDAAISEALKKIGGVLEAVTIANEKSGKTYSFVVVDDGKMMTDKSAVINAEKKIERIWELVWDRTYSKTDLEESEDDFD